MRSYAYSAIAAASLLSVAMADIDPIVIKGSKFFHQNSGEQFFIKGIAYQRGVGAAGSAPSTNGDSPDPLADGDACKRDVPILKELDTNTIRVYAVDPTKDHSECMKLLADAEIYVVADLSEPSTSINRDDPGWTDELFTRYASVVDEMQKYDNVMGFFAGNEVSNAKNNTDASAFVKASVRDMKAYIKNKNYREIGVGYATNDDSDIRQNMADYFNCGSADESVDFWGYNIYSWCGQSSFQESGYDIRTTEFKDFNIPVFFAEYGCITPPRLFLDTPVLFGPLMNEVWSGGIVYMYFQEANDYGLVKVTGDSVQKLPDFTALQKQITKVNPKGVSLNSYTPTNTAAQKCPAVGKDWGAQNDPLPPAANPQLCACMVDSLTCVVKSSVHKKAYGDMFDYACKHGDKNTCIGTFKDAEKGEYGAYSMCSPEEQLGWVLTQYQKSQGGSAGACDFDGQAQTQSPKDLSTQCNTLVSQAGKSGTGTVTSQPSNAGATSSGASSHMSVPSFDFGLLKMSAYVFGAVITGFGVILL